MSQKENKEKVIKAATDIDEDLVPPPPEETVVMKEMWPLRWGFVWFTEIIAKGFFKTPTLQTIPKLQSTSRVEYVEKQFDWIWEKTKGFPFQLFLCINYCFGIEFWIGGFVQFLGIVATIFLPKVMEKFLTLLFLPEKDENLVSSINMLRRILPSDHEIYPEEASEYYRPNNWEIWIWCGLLVLLYMFTTWSRVYGMQVGTTVGMKIRSAIVNKIYQKSMVMSNKSRDEFENGVIVNHVTMDVFQIEMLNQLFHYGWASWVLLGGSIYFLIGLIDWGTLSGFLVCGGVVPFIFILVGFVLLFRSYVVKMIDGRTNKTNETLQGIKIIKFFGWEQSFLSAIEKLRFKEILGTRGVYLAFSALITITISLTTFMALASFITFFLVHDHVDTVAFFTSLTYFSQIRLPMMISPMVIVAGGQMIISMSRIEKFLHCEEMETLENNSSSEKKDSKHAVVIKKGFFEWETKPKKEGRREKRKRKGKAFFKKMLSLIGIGKEEEQEKQKEKKEEKEEIGRLDNINLKVKKGDLVAVVGAVGSGKSSLLGAILGEMKLKKGTMEVNSSISYTSQNAWMQTGTLYDNVLFGEPENVNRWKECVRVCALTDDLKILKGGKNIEIGEKGINLSGGQKYRVQLARACYSKKDLVLLDDPLAAVDAHVGKHIFHKCIKGWLEDRTRILVTHQLSYLKHVDHVVYIKDGRIHEQGKFQELMENQGELYHLVTEFSEKEEKEKKKGEIDDDSSPVSSSDDEKKTDLKKKKKNKKDGDENDEENKIIAEEEQRKGMIHPKFYVHYFASMGPCYGIPALIAILVTFVVAQFIVTGSDWWLSEWTNLTFNEQFSKYCPVPFVYDFDPATATMSISYYDKGHHVINDTTTNATLVQIYSDATKMNENSTTDFNCSYLINTLSSQGSDVEPMFSSFDEDDSQRYYCPSSYFGYCGCLNNRINAVWSNYENKDEKIEDGITHYVSMTIYGIFGVLSLFAIYFRSAIATNAALWGNQKLHNAAIRGVMNAPMSFFDQTPLGRITSRFTNDIMNMDGMMIQAFMQALGMGMGTLGMFFMIGYSTNGLGLIFVIPLLFFYFIFYILYRKTNLELKRMESVSKSPLMSHISESLNGLPTIRAYGVEEDFKREVKYKINLNNRAYYLMTTAQKWLGLNLGILGVFFIGLVCSMCIIALYYAEFDWNVSYISLAVSYSIQATQMFYNVVEQLTQFEVQMNGVERLTYFERYIDQEKALLTNEEVIRSIGNKHWEQWPKTGKIEFRNFSMNYREGLPLVLKQLNLTIKNKEKVGIVGRTGSGKSTLMVALFRIVEAFEGEIYIDGVNINEIGLLDLRKKLAIIPQDAILFTGTVRTNLDPFNEHSDDEVWECLRKSFLSKKIKSLPHKLNEEVKEGGSNFSIGERQLLCLARAILRDAKILILDECTASVDLKTDNLIQKTIRREFKNVTTLTIAHRLNTIIDSDRVLVMDDGKVAEFDTPKNLVEKEKGHLKDLILETGPANASFLFSVARGEMKLQDGEENDLVEGEIGENDVEMTEIIKIKEEEEESSSSSETNSSEETNSSSSSSSETEEEDASEESS